MAVLTSETQASRVLEFKNGECALEASEGSGNEREGADTGGGGSYKNCTGSSQYEISSFALSFFGRRREGHARNTAGLSPRRPQCRVS